jgi:ergosteryl-3beta-O-L-aspartate synthase
MDGNTISFRARIHTIRRLSARLVFVVFRQQTITIQGVLQMESDNEKEAGQFQTSHLNSQASSYFLAQDFVLMKSLHQAPD